MKLRVVFLGKALESTFSPILEVFEMEDTDILTKAGKFVGDLQWILGRAIDELSMNKIAKIEITSVNEKGERK